MKKGILKKALSMLLIGSGVLALAACQEGDTPNISDTSTEESQKPDTPVIKNPNATDLKDKYDTISIKEALEIAEKQGEDPTKEKYCIYGEVINITKIEFGAMTIKDSTGSIEIWNTKGMDNTEFPNLDIKPAIGDEIVIMATLHSHGGNKAEVKQANIVEIKKKEFTNYEAVSIKEAREKTNEAKIKVTGVVSKITFANGLKPNGFLLTDDTGSIYVYGAIAGELTEGNKVTIAGSKKYYIKDDEKNAAAIWGYQGANQIADAVILENDGKINEYSSNSIETKPIKDIVETPFSEDITGSIYDTKAYVKRFKEGGERGYVYYHFYDLDQKSFIPTYSQADGADFAWLDEFDGEIIDLRFTPLNAKATTASAYYRAVPISAKKASPIELTQDEAAEFIYRYYINEEVKPTYEADPKLTLDNIISNELLNINATVSYSSSNENILKVVSEGNKTKLNLVNEGSANLTIKITVNGVAKDFIKEISLKKAQKVDYINVLDAINTTDGNEVVVKGIAGPSLTNQTGFYLIDENGAIAIRTTGQEMDKIAFGNEVIVKGLKKHHVANGKDPSTVNGQIVIDDATIVTNLGGSYEYSTNSFISGKTLDDLIEMAKDPLSDHTAEVYFVEAKIEIKVNPNYTSVNILSPTTNKKLMVYSGGGADLLWLEEFSGQVVTLEVSLCNWNSKGVKACILSASDGSTKLYSKLSYKK